VSQAEHTPRCGYSSRYDYTNQAWTVCGKYIRCGHPETMNCRCYGKIHAGEQADMVRVNRENER
jgi:hypothetical protein